MKLIIDKSKEGTKLPEVMRSAIKLFVEKGIDGTTIKDISKSANVSEGALYRHFKGKNELAWYIFTTSLNEFSNELMRIVDKEGSIKEKVRSLVAKCFESFENNKDLFTYLILSEHRELNKFPNTHMHPGHVALKLIDEGQKAGKFKEINVYVASSFIVGSIIRMCVVKMYGNIKEDLKNFIDETTECIWNGLKK